MDCQQQGRWRIQSAVSQVHPLRVVLSNPINRRIDRRGGCWLAGQVSSSVSVHAQ